MHRFLLFAATCLLLHSCHTDPPVPEPAAPIRCYIMAGQSNMAGRGAVSREDSLGDPRVLVLAEDEHWQPAREPLHFYQPYFAGLDCGLSFGKTLLNLRTEAVQVGLLPCAVGSTDMAEWLGDSLHIVRLYSNLLERAAAAQASGGTICGVLWHQGEADATDGFRSSLYETRLRIFIQNCRRDLGSERLPFFLGLLADFNRFPYRDSVNAALRRVAATVPAVYLIDTHDLSCKSDSLHFDSEGQRELGRRYARAAAALP